MPSVLDAPFTPLDTALEAFCGNSSFSMQYRTHLDLCGGGSRTNSNLDLKMIKRNRCRHMKPACSTCDTTLMAATR